MPRACISCSRFGFALELPGLSLTAVGCASILSRVSLTVLFQELTDFASSPVSCGLYLSKVRALRSTAVPCLAASLASLSANSLPLMPVLQSAVVYICTFELVLS